MVKHLLDTSLAQCITMGGIIRLTRKSVEGIRTFDQVTGSPMPFASSLMELKTGEIYIMGDTTKV